MAETTVQDADRGSFPACRLRKPGWLAAICLAVMAVLLLLAAYVFTAYEIRQLVAFRIYNPFSVTVVGLYIFVFVAINSALSLPSLRLGALLAVPAAALAGWSIVAGPAYGWLIKAGIFVAFAVSYVVCLGTFFAVFMMALFGPLIGPLATGSLTGLLVHFAARLIAGQPLWDRPARKEAMLHCLGFIVGAYIVYFAIHGIDKDLARLRNTGAGLAAFVWLLWPIFLGAPAVHLACLAFARHRGGWLEGTLHPKRLLVLCLALFAVVGIGRSLHFDNAALLLTWPAKDLQTAQFWKNHPRRGTPLTIGEYRVGLSDDSLRREWNRDLQQYDYFQIGVSEDLWPAADAKARMLEVRLREAHAPYLPVLCDRPADYGLLRCRPREADEQDQAGAPSVPAYWVKFDYELYAAPERPDLVLARKKSFSRDPSEMNEDYDLSLAWSESHHPRVSAFMALRRFELARWAEAADAFDQITAHHLRR